MRTFRTVTVVGWACALALGFVSSSCGLKDSSTRPSSGPGRTEGAAPAGPAKTPKGTFDGLKAALGAGDFGAVYDMMSPDARREADARVKKAAEDAAAMGPLAKTALGFDPAELAGLSPRKAYAKLEKGAHETSAKLEKSIGARGSGLAGAKLVKTETEGDRSTVTAELPCGARRQIKLAREGGLWKLAEPLSGAGE